MLTQPLSDLHLSRLDLKCASRLVNVASAYHSDVYVRYDRGRVHMGSLIGVVAISSLKGSHFTLVADGIDEKKAMAAILEAWKV